MNSRFWLIACLLAALSGCGGSGSRDDVELTNVSYDPTRELYEEVNTAFIAEQKTKGKQVTITQSHGGAGAQTRAVIDGLPADVVTLALATDIDILVDKGLVAANWQTRLADHACPYTSTIVFLVRAGNPKSIKDWSDLVRPDIKVITPNPKTSGGAKYNFLAAYGFMTLHQKKSDADATEYIRQLYRNVPKLDTGARGSTDTFVRRKLGDVLLAWENEAILSKKELPDEKLEIIYPSVSIRAEPPVAVVDKVVDVRGTRAQAEAYLQFLYTPQAQDIVGKNGYRPRDPAAQAKYADSLPPIKLFTVPEVAGDWQQAQKKFFADGGLFDQIYQPEKK